MRFSFETTATRVTGPRHPQKKKTNVGRCQNMGTPQEGGCPFSFPIHPTLKRVPSKPQAFTVYLCKPTPKRVYTLQKQKTPSKSSSREDRIRVPFCCSPILVGEPSQPKRLVKGHSWGTYLFKPTPKRVSIPSNTETPMSTSSNQPPKNRGLNKDLTSTDLKTLCSKRRSRRGWPRAPRRSS